MKLSVFGLGYVGCVTAACFAELGHQVIGVEVDAQKLSLIAAGQSPFWEPGLESLVKKHVHSGSLQVTGEAGPAVAQSEVAFICVGTPSAGDGSPNLFYVKRVVEDISRALRDQSSFFVLALRSTLLPGLVERELIPLAERLSGKVAGQDFDVVVNPEFLRTGNAVEDFLQPPWVVIGSHRPRSSQQVAQAYRLASIPFIETDFQTACLLKYACNIFHGLKVAFANEVGILAKALGVDGHLLMQLFCQDRRLNISPAYLKPGFAFGGSCLLKDMRAVLAAAHRLGLALPLLEAIPQSNESHLNRCLEILQRSPGRRLGLIGLTFKANTDDLRDSPAVALARGLIAHGFELKIYDRQLARSAIYGSNRAFLEQALPNIAGLLVSSLEELIGWGEVIIVTQSLTEDEKKKIRDLEASPRIVDFVRAWEPAELRATEYYGLAW